ncbi:hypothetical protein V2J09_017935 [Rumex salicifolius]
MHRKEMLWLQRAKTDEMKWSDKNTVFFNHNTSGHQKRNALRAERSEYSKPRRRARSSRGGYARVTRSWRPCMAWSEEKT